MVLGCASPLGREWKYFFIGKNGLGVVANWFKLVLVRVGHVGKVGKESEENKKKFFLNYFIIFD